MRIFYFLDSFQIGGTETQAIQAAICLARSHQLTFGCLNACGPLLKHLEEAKIEVVEFPPGTSLMSARAVRQSLRLQRFLRERRFEVFHAHDVYSNVMGVPMARMARIPLVIASRRDLGDWWWYTPRNRFFLRQILRLANVVVANSAMVAEYVETSEGVPRRKLRVIRNAVKLTHAPPVQSPAHRSIICVGNMHTEAKGHRYLLEAAVAVISAHPSVQFLLIGDGPLRSRLERLSHDLGLSGSVTFLGQREDVHSWLRSAECAVLPSLSEGLPNAVLEYMAAGLPIVATRVGGIPELIHDQVDGLLVPPADAHALGEALVRVLTDRALSGKIAKNAFQRAASEYSIDALIRALERLYSGLNSEVSCGGEVTNGL
jgi:glycosyltransferase involved in cell wall biosynthesis